MADVKKVIDDISDLPTLPDVVAKLNRLISDPNTSAGDINDVLSRDVSLSAKILKLVNSPYYGFPRRITTITYAVVILGFNTVRNLALSAFIFDSFKKGRKNFDIEGFWRNSIATAIAASAVAKKTGLWQDEEAFMSGLLHGVGKVIMNQYLPEDLDRVMECVKEKDCLFIDAARGILGYTHEEIGGLLLEKWNLPEQIVDAVAHVSCPSQSEKAPELATVLHFAGILTKSLLIGFTGDHKIQQIEPEAWARLNLGFDAVSALMDKVKDEYSRSGAFFEA